jgi:structural maintenance of chromosome 3 (chondroitin sulfate proteoglycan 6)
VEVVFDNSDNRFALEASDEVVLRRTIGAKKDEFFVQRKRAKKQEVQSLLEGAGFSKSNPYFMVQQGKIQALCTMTDAQRLELLQQVAGTTVYEDKKAESLVKMQENKQSLEKIQTILDDLDEKLEELQEEKQELTQYQQADRQRKALEYTLYDKELRKARTVLDSIEHDRTDHVQELTTLQDKAAQTLEHVSMKEADIKAKYNAASRNRRTRQHLEEDKLKAVTAQAQLQLNCQELAEQVQSGKETLEQNQKELKKLEKEISKAQNQLKAKETELSKQSKALQQLQQNKDQAQRQMDSIYAKQGRGQQYATKEARDKVLKKQIRDLEKAQEEKKQLLAEHQSSLGNVRRTIQETQQEIEAKQQEITEKTQALQGMTKALDEKKKNQIDLHEERKQAWRECEALQDKVQETRDALGKATADMRKSMPRNTAMGLKALEAIVEQEKLVIGEQYFGSLVENFTLKDPKFQTAVEVAAQNSLFHVIVDSDSTAALLMKRLEDGKLGRVTFLPLNRLNSSPTQAPANQNEVKSLMEMCLDFEPKVAKAMYHVFEKKLLARNTQVAAEWSVRSKMDCITLDGDLCARKGALTGGYVDPNKSRIRAYLAQKEAKSAYQKANQDFLHADSSNKQLAQNVNNVNAEVSRLQGKQVQMQRAVQTLQQQVQDLIHSTMKQNEEQAKKLEEVLIPPMERDIAATSGDIERLEQEIGTELQQTLTADDRATLESLKTTLSDVSAEIQTQQDAVEELRGDTQSLQSLLEDNLLKRQDELTQGMVSKEDGATTAANFQESKQRELEERQKELEEASKAVEDLDEKLQEARQAEQDLQSELVAAKSELDKLRNQDAKNRKALEEASEKSEKLMSKVCTFKLFQRLYALQIVAY